MDGQISLFDDLGQDEYGRPSIGTKVEFLWEGKSYPAVVTTMCGFDWFWIQFTGRKPCDDDPEVDDSNGWHVSARGCGKDWIYG